jgi:hypothetical protein
MSDPRDDFEGVDMSEGADPETGDDLSGGPVAPDAADDQATETNQAAQGTGDYGPGVDIDTGAHVGDTGEPELEGHSPS